MTEITLVPIDLSHAPAVQALASHPDIIKNTRLPDPYPENGAVDWIGGDLVKERSAGRQEVYAIIVNGTFVGPIGLIDIDHQKAEAEIGYWIGIPFWGNGYASEALLLAIEKAKEMNLRRLHACVNSSNPASMRVLEKQKFVLTKKCVGTEECFDKDTEISYFELLHF